MSETSRKQVNPRHIYGAYLYIHSYALLDFSGDGIYKWNERGKGFAKYDKDVVYAFDEAEGLLRLLSILTAKPGAKRADLIPEWSEYLHRYSKFSTTSTFNDTLRRRLGNLVQRGLVEQSGNAYTLSIAGLAYRGSYKPEDDSEVLHVITAHNSRRREEFRASLQGMPPYQFEKLVSQLLEGDREFFDAQVETGVDDEIEI